MLTYLRNYEPASPEVNAYSSVIQEYATKYGIGEYTELIKAVMMQESGGRSRDPMQCSESPYNKKYPKKPGGIKDPEYSIDCGIHYLADCLKAAKVKNPLDMERIRLALQGNNYGNGYIKSGTMPKFSIVSDGSNWFKEKHLWQKNSYKQSPGDMIFFDWDGNGNPNHVGIVEKCDEKRVYTIEGNSSDQCRKRIYFIGGAQIFGYGVPKY